MLEKFEGKGGWTFARIPEIAPDPKAHFGWVRVRGSIDGYAIEKYHLMPMGNGCLFLPVKAEIRKKIRKQVGDWVRVTLYLDDLPKAIPEEFIACLRDEPNAYQHFIKLTENQQQSVSNWIYSAKTDAQKVERIAQAINKLLNR